MDFLKHFFWVAPQHFGREVPVQLDRLSLPGLRALRAGVVPPQKPPAPDKTVEMLDIKNRRVFLKRCPYPSLEVNNLFLEPRRCE